MGGRDGDGRLGEERRGDGRESVVGEGNEIEGEGEGRVRMKRQMTKHKTILMV